MDVVQETPNVFIWANLSANGGGKNELCFNSPKQGLDEVRILAPVRWKQFLNHEIFKKDSRGQLNLESVWWWKPLIF